MNESNVLMNILEEEEKEKATLGYCKIPHSMLKCQEEAEFHSYL